MKLAAAAASVASAAPATTPATPRVLLAGICNPYEPGVGTKVLPSAVREFQARMNRAVQEFDFGGARVPGQGFVPFNEGAHTLSAGIGRRSENPADFCLRQHRGRVEAFLRREWAPPCEGAALIIYTREAYLADPDVQADRAESARIRESSAPTLWMWGRGARLRSRPTAVTTGGITRRGWTARSHQGKRASNATMACDE